MSLTNFTAIASHVMDEILGQALAPLFRKYVLLDKLNRSSLDGLGTAVREIPVRNAIAEAAPGFEGASAASVQMTYGSPVTLTPVEMKQLIEMSLKAIRRRMPGVSYAEAMNRIRSGDPSSLPLVADAVELSLDSHLRAAERLGLALFTGLSRSAGASGATLTAAHLIDAQTKYLNGDTGSSVQGKPEHEEMVFVLDEIGVGQIRTFLSTGSGTGLATLFANPQTDLSIFSLAPDTNRSGLRGGFAGTAIYACDGALQAQDATDRFGALIAVGRGAAGDSGSQRGFAEFCEGHPPGVEFEYDAKAGVLSVPSSWEYVLAEHTDLHGVEMIYKKTIT